MALSIQGWINGITASSIVIFGVTLGIFMVYSARKSKIKLLLILGFSYIFGGLLWLVNFVEFLYIINTGKNLDPTSILIFNILTWMWLPPAIICALYISTEFLFKEKKWYLLSVIIILGIIYELYLFISPTDVLFFEYPKNPGEDLVNEDIIVGTIFYFIMIFLILCLLIFNGVGLTIKGFKSTGIVRKKMLLLAIGFSMWTIFGMLEALGIYGILLIPVRMCLIFGLIFWYLGLREEPEKVKKVPTKKEVKIEGDLFRISKRPDQITEEEVSISKEKKICLVCKNKAIGFNIFICPNCEAFYCGKCSQVIIELENACWVCNAPIDESKPVKPFKKEEEAVDLEISEKPKKTPQKPK